MLNELQASLLPQTFWTNSSQPNSSALFNHLFQYNTFPVFLFFPSFQWRRVRGGEGGLSVIYNRNCNTQVIILQFSTCWPPIAATIM